MVERIRRLFRIVSRRIEGYLRFMTKWGNSRMSRPDLHPPGDTARAIMDDGPPAERPDRNR